MREFTAAVGLHFVAIIPAPVVCGREKNKSNYTYDKGKKDRKSIQKRRDTQAEVPKELLVEMSKSFQTYFLLSLKMLPS